MHKMNNIMTSSIRMSIALLILAQILDPSNANLVQSNGAGKVCLLQISISKKHGN